MFKASQIINKTIVRNCNSMDEDCITNLVYPCPEICETKEVVVFKKFLNKIFH